MFTFQKERYLWRKTWPKESARMEEEIKAPEEDPALREQRQADAKKKHEEEVQRIKQAALIEKGMV